MRLQILSDLEAEQAANLNGNRLIGRGAQLYCNTCEGYGVMSNILFQQKSAPLSTMTDILDSEKMISEMTVTGGKRQVKSSWYTIGVMMQTQNAVDINKSSAAKGTGFIFRIVQMYCSCSHRMEPPVKLTINDPDLTPIHFDPELYEVAHYTFDQMDTIALGGLHLFIIESLTHDLFTGAPRDNMRIMNLSGEVYDHFLAREEHWRQVIEDMRKTNSADSVSSFTKMITNLLSLSCNMFIGEYALEILVRLMADLLVIWTEVREYSGVTTDMEAEKTWKTFAEWATELILAGIEKDKLQKFTFDGLYVFWDWAFRENIHWQSKIDMKDERYLERSASLKIRYFEQNRSLNIFDNPNSMIAAENFLVAVAFKEALIWNLADGEVVNALAHNYPCVKAVMEYLSPRDMNKPLPIPPTAATHAPAGDAALKAAKDILLCMSLAETSQKFIDFRKKDLKIDTSKIDDDKVAEYQICFDANLPLASIAMSCIFAKGWHQNLLAGLECLIADGLGTKEPIAHNKTWTFPPQESSCAPLVIKKMGQMFVKSLPNPSLSIQEQVKAWDVIENKLRGKYGFADPLWSFVPHGHQFYVHMMNQRAQDNTMSWEEDKDKTP